MERHTPRRRRPALSCLECRRRKIKCDRSNPCAHCVSAKSQCSYKVYRSELGAGQQSRLRPRRSPDSTLSPSAEAASPDAQTQPTRTASEYGSHLSVPQVAASLRQGSNSIASRLNEKQLPSHSSDTEPDLRALLQRIQKLEESAASSPAHAFTETGREILERRSGLQDSEIILNKTRILGWSQWMGTTSEVSLHSKTSIDSLLTPSSLQLFLVATPRRTAKAMELRSRATTPNP